jgi:tetratricopeptide (TPR) repeat protein
LDAIASFYIDFYLSPANFLKARKILDKCVITRPDFAPAHYNLARYYAGELQQFDLALVELDRTLRHASGSLLGHAYRRMADVHYFVKQYEEAEALYQQALEVIPGDAFARNGYGNLLRVTKRFPEAIEQYEAGLKTTPTEPSLHSNLGLAYYQWARLGSTDEYVGRIGIKRAIRAREILEHALSLFPNSVEILNNLGLVYRIAGGYELSVKVLRRAAELAPQDPEVQHNLRGSMGLWIQSGGPL